MKTFKTLTIIGLITFLSACGKESSTCTEIQEGISFEFSQGDVLCLNDEFEITITEVIDERCPCDAICIWAGEFKFTLDILREGISTQYTHHAESVFTVPDPSPLGLTFSDVELLSDDPCETMMPLSDLEFRMTVN